MIKDMIQITTNDFALIFSTQYALPQAARIDKQPALFREDADEEVPAHIALCGPIRLGINLLYIIKEQ